MSSVFGLSTMGRSPGDTVFPFSLGAIVGCGRRAI